MCAFHFFHGQRPNCGGSSKFLEKFRNCRKNLDFYPNLSYPISITREVGTLVFPPIKIEMS